MANEPVTWTTEVVGNDKEVSYLSILASAARWVDDAEAALRGARWLVARLEREVPDGVH